MSNAGSDTETSSVGAQRRKGVIDTRRAEQNRAAQRAFRQRKERYVKELENKVRDMQGLQNRVENLEDENARLRQRIWELSHRPTTTTATSTSWNPSDEESVPPLSTSRSSTATTSTTTTTSTKHHTARRYHPYSSTPTPTPLPPPTLHPPTTTSSSSSPPPPLLNRSPLHPTDHYPPRNITRHYSTKDHHRQQSSHGDMKEEDRVLDDLITVLRSRHRPPIPSHLGGDSSCSSNSQSPPPTGSLATSIETQHPPQPPQAKASIHS
ncbi:hypothetical protein K492DRAFT_177755 [Lichtheimia hyalospora FSU 10163]|nr:hypothetical protein K492DRAFT_177755 [Lichtheimia hyalospora FSU 10163]